MTTQSLSLLSVDETGAISAGAYHVVALKTDGTVWAWGENSALQLGGVAGARLAKPVQVVLPGTATPTAISAGGFHTLVLLDDGTVAAFGRNSEGQLGNGGTGNGPVAVSTLTDVIAVAAGGYHSLALKSDGTVWAWGISTNGQLGTGTFLETTPVQVAAGTLTNVAAIGAGSFASYAVKSDGTAWAWGSNASGQLGDGTYADQASPVAVSSLTDVVAIAGGWDHAAALKSDGTVWTWGSNWSGQLGDWYFGGSGTPIQAVGVAGAVEIATGSDHTLAKLSDGSMWSWGGNFNGQLGTGEAWVSTLNFDPLPTQIGTGVVQVTAGGYTSFALRDDGTISGFGYVEYGQMGDGLYQGKPFPVQAFDLKEGGVSAVGGRFHGAIVLDDGTVGWVGHYDTQNLYIGGLDPDDQRYDLKILTLAADVVEVASGDQHTLARLANGTVWAWGFNASGQLGNGTNTTSMTPVQVSGLTNVVAVAADASTSLAVKADGTVWVWGDNSAGQFADGTTNPANTPVQVVATGLSGITTADVGVDHVIARKNDGTVWIWGNNDMGQLVGGAATVLTPTQVAGLSNAVEVASGSGFSLVRHGDGTVSTWGFNDYGQLGHGDTTLRTSPVAITGLSGVAEITAGTAHVLVRMQDGTLRAWGNNELGQLGDGTFVNRLAPATVKRLGGVQAIAAGFLHSLAVKTDGSVWTWGNNGNEQLAVSVRHEHRPAIRLIPDVNDTGQLGVTHDWLIEHFGTIYHDVTQDSDLDGWTDIQEFVLGTNPTLPDTTGNGLDDIADPFPLDFYSGAAPTLSIVAGNNQTSLPSVFLPQGITLEVRDAAGQLLKNAPVAIAVTTGGGKLARINTGASQLYTTLDLKTNANGRLTVYYRQGPGLSVGSTLTFTAAGTSVSAIAYAGTITDTDGDGMPDDYEIAMGLDPNVNDATGDLDGDGVPNNEDARPGDPGVGQLSVTITTPAHGTIIP